jgi:hypothetical protein
LGDWVIDWEIGRLKDCVIDWAIEVTDWAIELVDWAIDCVIAGFLDRPCGEMSWGLEVQPPIHTADPGIASLTKSYPITK